jgi:threonine aldolase
VGIRLQSNRTIDLRSDTVTLPTDEMLEAIKTAKLGDDVYGEDSTVNKLQEIAAKKMGKDAALLVTSGTQANLTSLMSNCNRGEQVFLEAESHIYWHEVGGVSAIAGLLPWPIKSPTGAIEPEQIESQLHPRGTMYPDATLICVENTHNRYGGKIITPNQIKALRQLADKHQMRLYMDGARIFNSAIALGIDVKEFTKHVDNLMFCLSKGLSCPVGSLAVGDRAFIERARKNRKILGGGMRQAGIIAAPGIVALEKMIDRLKEDHENAKLLAQKISKVKDISLDLKNVQTNMVTFDLDPAVDCDKFLAELKKSGILASAQAKNRVRIVTHWGIDKADVEKAAGEIERILSPR